MSPCAECLNRYCPNDDQLIFASDLRGLVAKAKDHHIASQFKDPATGEYRHTCNSFDVFDDAGEKSVIPLVFAHGILDAESIDPDLRGLCTTWKKLCGCKNDPYKNDGD